MYTSNTIRTIYCAVEGNPTTDTYESLFKSGFVGLTSFKSKILTAFENVVCVIYFLRRNILLR